MSSRVNGSEQAEAVKGRALQEVERDVAHVVEELSALKAERDSLPALVEAASAGFDSARLAELEGRRRELEARIGGAQGRLFLLYAERARVQLPAAEAAAAAAKLAYDQAHAEYLKAHELTNRLGVEANNTMMHAERLRLSVEENERRARELSGQAARQS